MLLSVAKRERKTISLLVAKVTASVYILLNCMNFVFPGKG